MVNVTASTLRSIAAAAGYKKPAAAIVNGIEQYWWVAGQAGITTVNEAAAFLGNACIETDGFKTLEEYASGADYEGRKDLGNTQKGDGRKFKGRGIFQNTGRSNMESLTEALGPDFVTKPTLLLEAEWSMKAAVFYWKQKKLGPYAKRGEFVKVGRGINRGSPNAKGAANHEAERLRACNKAVTLLGKSTVVTTVTAKPPVPVEIAMADPPKEWKGDKLVFYVQGLLLAKGYDAGLHDGLMGKRTEGAVLAFRNEQVPPLRNVNSIDQELVTALEVAPARTVSVERAKTTAADLVSGGDETSRTMGTAQKVVTAGGLLAGFGGLDQQGVTDRAKQAVEGAGALREIGEQALDLLQWAAQKWWIPVLLICGYLYIRNREVIRKRVEEHRTGKTTAI